MKNYILLAASLATTGLVCNNDVKNPLVKAGENIKEAVNGAYNCTKEKLHNAKEYVADKLHDGKDKTAEKARQAKNAAVKVTHRGTSAIKRGADAVDAKVARADAKAETEIEKKK